MGKSLKSLEELSKNIVKVLGTMPYLTLNRYNIFIQSNIFYYLVSHFNLGRGCIGNASVGNLG